jgi:hypothetical protein
MKKFVVLLLFVMIHLSFSAAERTDAKGSWSMNVTTIEACSCPMFCQCYFNTKPAMHPEHGSMKHYCRSNMAFRVNHGQYGSSRLEGAKFWVAADIGEDFSEGQMNWAVLIFDQATDPQQREGIQTMLGHLFPVKWRSFTTKVGTINNWSYDKNFAYAALDGGRTGEIKLRRFPGMSDEPVLIKNLKYWAAPRNDGFVLMQNEVEAYRTGSNAFEYKGTSGFMITIDMKSKDFAYPQR